MNEQEIYELYYQSWIKKHLRTILLIASIVICIGFVTEAMSYINNQRQMQAQALLEHYLETPETKVSLTLKHDYPRAIQTHLVLLLEAKQAYLNEDIDLAISHLDFIRLHCQDPEIVKLSNRRLAALYQVQHKSDAAKSLLDSDDAYTKLQLALSEDDAQTRFQKLNEAWESNPSPYVNALIATAQNDNITS